jgi:hypothetical protein
MTTRRLLPLFIIILAMAACNMPTDISQPTDVPVQDSPTTVIIIDPTDEPPLATVTPIPSTAALTQEQLQNAEVKITGVLGESPNRVVKLTNGSFESGEDPTSPEYVNVNMGQKVAFGDLNGDGAQDAAIIIGENYGGTGDFVSVVAMLNQNGQPVYASSFGVDDRPIINSLTIQNGEILLDATTHRPNDPGCCPNQPMTLGLRLWGGQLVQTQRITKLPDNVTERIIKIESPADGSELSGPFTLSGSVTIAPFENNLSYKVFLQGATEPIIQAGTMVNAAEMGGPGTFSLPINLTESGVHGNVRIEISDLSAADGSYLAVDTLFLTIK